MAGRYDLRSQDESDFASLPGTSANLHFVKHNVTEQKSKAITGREMPGCNPSRWIYELLHNCFTTCDLHARARYADLDTPFDWEHQHRLVMNGNQSSVTNSKRVLSSLCIDCHFHFVFKIEWDEAHTYECCNPEQAAWPMKDSLFPWHHLVWTGSEPDPMLAQYKSKYQPLLAREYFVCTAPPCTFQITLDVLEPRMGRWWIQLLQDEEAILAQLKKAKELEPQRYEGANESWASLAPQNLNTYLKDLIESDPDQVRNVSKRNKKFAVVFGPRCAEIFRQLEFTDEILLNEKGIDEGVLVPKVPDRLPQPGATTPLGTFRAYIEDVRAEVQCLIHKRGHGAELPTYILPLLQQSLGYTGTLKITNQHLINIDRYMLLGILPDQSKEVIVNTYFRQWDLLPSKKRELIDALVGVANDVSDEQLSEFAVTQQSVFESQLERHDDNTDDDGITNQAIIYLGLSPPNTYDAETIINAFRKKLVQQPDDASTARNMLMMIAQASSSGEYQELLLTEATGLSFETSKAILEFTGWAGDWKQCLQLGEKKIEESKSKDEVSLYIEALDCVAEQLKSQPLMAAVGRLRERHRTQVSAPGDATNQAGTLTLPVGLLNIGNTCYLNSLLQYLFTVKAVREIILNYDNYKLELKDEDIQKRRIGGNKMQMDRGEAIVAQAFVHELTELFNNLAKSDKVAARPSQRLANAALLSTHSIIEDAKKDSAKAAHTAPVTTVHPLPPPLPARPSQSPDPPQGDKIVVASEQVKEVSETSSPRSSLTLVDAPDANAEAAAAEEAMDSSMHLSFDDKSTTVVTATPSAVDESPTTGATSPADQDQTQTAEAKPVDSDIAMADEELPLTIDEKVLGALEHQSRAGTDQQDVEEVIGNIINRLQAAIQPSSINEQTGIQMELIMETFFVKMVNYTKKFGEPTYQTEVGFDRSITAYPAAKGSCTLYDALARNFDQQVLAESKLWRYTAIQKLPPVLHVLIQRSSVGHKNENPVIIPETLYLDRYMDTDHGSPEFKLRNAQWAVANRLDDLKEIKEALGAPEPKRIKLDCDADEVELREIASFDPSFDVEGPLSVDFREDAQSSDESAKEAEATEATTAEPASAESAATQPSSSESSSEPMATDPASTKPAPTEGQATYESNPELETKIWDMMQEELEKRGEQLRDELEGPKNHPYRLQAVICHTGRLTSGHYWVWIHDFEKHVWRKYNDEYVEENPETDAVLKQLNQSGHPYYLCYVRDEDKNDFVNVPERSIPEPPTYESLPKADETSRVDSDGDCAIIDSDEDVKVAMAKHREVVEVMDAPAPEDVPDLV